MKQKLLFVFVGIVAVANAASIYQKRSADIPVQVVYDKPSETALASLRNLEEKPQLPVAQIVKEEDKIKVEELPPQPAVGLKNLEAKPQLSPTEELEALKSVPKLDENVNIVKIVTPNENAELVKPQNVNEQSAPYKEESIDDIYDKIQEIINNGAKRIQIDFEKLPNDSAMSGQKDEILQKVNATLEEFLDNTKKLIELRDSNTLKQDASVTPAPAPAPGNIFQQILNTFQTFSSNLFSGIVPPNQQSQVLSDGTTAAPGQIPNPLQIAQNVFSQLQGNLGSLFGARPPANAQSDENPPQNNNPLQFIQQTFNNIFRPTSAPGAQNEEQPAPPPNPVIGFVQTAIQNVQNAFQPSTAATPAQHDDVTQGTTPGGPLQFFQTAGQNVINALQNNPLIPGQASTTTAPHVLAQSTTNNPAAIGQNAINQINQIAQSNQQIPGISNVPSIPNVPNVPNVPSIPNVPNVPSIPNVPGISNVPNVPSIPNVPNVPSIPNIPNNQIPVQVPEQGQQVISTGTNQATQVIASLTQQGVPIPDQVSSVINSAQQIGGGSTAKPPTIVTSPVVAPVVEVPSSDAIEVLADEVEPEADVDVPEPAKKEILVHDDVPVKEEAIVQEVPSGIVQEEISNEVTVNEEVKKQDATTPEVKSAK